jgi:hypothetical protein
MQLQRVIFSVPKGGSRPDEWEDGAAAAPAGRGRGGDPPLLRFAVADGATETYESRRWVELLIWSFMSADAGGGPNWPELERGAMSAWFKAVQEQWWAAAPTAADYIEQVKLSQGTLATFVGGELRGLDTPTPSWHAVALGDSVLFHVRDGRLLDQLPRLRAADFASTPEGISTRRERLGPMGEQLLLRDGRLEPGDFIFVATDAFAQWMLSRLEAGDPDLWRALAEMAHPSVFSQLVAAERRAMAMKDDDVTLMRIRLLGRPATTVVVCL